MSLARLFVVLAVVAIGCRKAPPPEVVGGIYAVSGHATVTVPSRKDYRRTARPGMTVMSHMQIAVATGVVVIEAQDGTLHALGKGPHDIARMKALQRPARLKRLALSVAETAEEREVPVPLIADRYEPYDSGQLAKETEDSSNFKYFFAPNNGGPEEVAPPTPAAPPPWMRTRGFIRAFTRAAPSGDGRRALTDADGVVVVEFRDRSTAIASTLALPLDLAEVERIAVVDGRATLKLPGGKLALEDGQIAEIAALD